MIRIVRITNGSRVVEMELMKRIIIGRDLFEPDGREAPSSLRCYAELRETDEGVLVSVFDCNDQVLLNGLPIKDGATLRSGDRLQIAGLSVQLFNGKSQGGFLGDDDTTLLLHGRPTASENSDQVFSGNSDHL